jgi:small GTP-binding protein
MSQTVTQQDSKLLGKILSLYKLMQNNRDMDTAEKIRELGRKSLEQEFSIAFCGHFSAGKSSMINKLVGENILPSSPIPTSANLVKIKSGKEYAKVYFKQGGARLYPAPYDYEAVKSYCKDGDQIQAIEISHSETEFLKEAVIMDTPGIDSTDDAHRIATESALHLSDIVFYVMDYNHVQSELNFLFTKELTDAGKELYLIINQIDKHQDAELSFKKFKQSVEESFADWGVKHSGIFYTSLRDPFAPNNQFNELQKFIVDRKQKRKEILPVSIFKSMEKLSEDHLSYLHGQVEDKLNEFEAVLQNLSESERIQLQAKMEQLRESKRLIENDANPEKEFDEGIRSILKNVYLMPFQTRELAEAYLQSIQPDFKVGLFFSKQKTEQERAERLDRFFSDLEEKVQSQIDWHIKDFLTKLVRKHNLTQHELQKSAQSFMVEFKQELLRETVKPGARLSGDYVLNYTNDVAEGIKNLARKKLVPIKEDFISNAKVTEDEELSLILEEEKELERLLDAWNGLSAILNELQNQRRMVTELLYGESVPHYGEGDYVVFKGTDEQTEVVVSDGRHDVSKVEQQTAQLPTEPAKAEKQIDNIEKYHEEQQLLIEKLTHTSSLIKDMTGLKKIARELKEKAFRLNDREFTVALFGAFSAGKSSFANALVGEKLLPVSPNPTTAAINKIKPVTKEHPHGSVVVKIKEEHVLMKEIERSLGLFGQSSSDFGNAIEIVSRLELEDTGYNAVEKTHYAFLKAFAKGYHHFNSRFGEKLDVDLESFRGYVAEEEKSCFVEWIEVYYDCPLTREGITLVDTPGADSINARHTGVAFDYIKNSDAILFVTYYNHAFSKADREFLIQLGRVKDTFELDKMFFVVNAVDLANSHEEQEAVLQYVEDQLVQYGIRKPHLFPVSSLNGLKAKLEPESGKDIQFSTFEQAFYSFIAHDLVNLAAEAAEVKWQQAVTLMEEMIVSAEEDIAVKAEKREKLKTEQENMLKIVSSSSAELLQDRLAQEADELVYYIRQRVFIRFGDFFREAFNPSLLKDDGRNLKKALESALDELIESVGYDFAQEMRATSLRIEAFIDKQLKDTQKLIINDLTKINKMISLSAAEIQPLKGIDFETAFQEIDGAVFKKAMAMFKNPKSFFEKNEKKLMNEELEKQLQAPAEGYLATENERLKKHYSEAMEMEFARILQDISEQINEYFEGITSALENNFSVSEVKTALKNAKEYGKG